MNGISRHWWMFLARGVASFAFVAFLLLWPDADEVRTLGLAFAAWALLDGAGSLAFVIRSKTTGNATYVGRGLVGLAMGTMVLFMPGVSTVGLFAIVGLWAMGTGGLEMAYGAAGWSKVPRAIGFMLVGLLALGFGMSLIHIPLESAATLRGFLVAFGVVNGVAAIVMGEELHAPPRLAGHHG